MTSPILVTGGTGRLGRLVVRRLQDAQCEVRVLTRRSRESAGDARFVIGDLATGEGIEAAVDGAAAIVHCATCSKGDVDATSWPAPAQQATPRRRCPQRRANLAGPLPHLGRPRGPR